MERSVTQNALPEYREKVSLETTFRGKYRFFAAFLICIALLLAAFAMTAILANGREILPFEESPQGETQAPPDAGTQPDASPEPVPVPDGATVIVSKNLSVLSLGSTYIFNETPYRPNVALLLDRAWERRAPTDEPLVLILHTHTSEGYLPDGTAYLTGSVGDATYTDDPTQSVLAVGETLCRVLNENGIGAIHCCDRHDDPTIGGAYERSAETVKRYLKEYPSIEYVIDLHRDAIVDADGALVRAVTEENGESVAQIMAVVGTDANGTEFDHWEENLTLALALREALNASGTEICRPVSLRNASFYQELAPHALLLEIGSSGCSPEEAERAAQRVGDALVDLIYGN